MRIIEGNIFAGMRMIIPEHREAMQILEQEEKRVVRPELDEQKLQDLSIMLSEAIQDSRMVTIKVYKPYGPKELQMVPLKVDPYKKQFKGTISEGNLVSIPLYDILDAWF